MQISISMSDVRMNEQDFLQAIKKEFNLPNDIDTYYHNDKGILVKEYYDYLEKPVNFSAVQQKAYEIYCSIKELYKLKELGGSENDGNSSDS